MPPALRLTQSTHPRAGTWLAGSAIEGALSGWAAVRWRDRVEMAGEPLGAFLVRSPDDGSGRATFWEREVRVPQDGYLSFRTAVQTLPDTSGDGIEFRVDVAPAGDGAGDYEKLVMLRHREASWRRGEVDLRRWQGRRLRIRLSAAGAPAPPRETRHMAWAGGHRSTASFYFREPGAAVAALELTIEGTVPFRIHRLAAHAHPDVVYREFEGGLVLANPGDRPFRFPLATLSDARHLRRLCATSAQDPVTNDGSPVRDAVLLLPRDALFLRRLPP